MITHQYILSRLHLRDYIICYQFAKGDWLEENIPKWKTYRNVDKVDDWVYEKWSMLGFLRSFFLNNNNWYMKMEIKQMTRPTQSDIK